MEGFRFWKTGYWKGTSTYKALLSSPRADPYTSAQNISTGDHITSGPLLSGPSHCVENVVLTSIPRSALYLVDLDRFRAIAAGDRLRQQYQGLSADPNSLANLDQDLPNNMQNQIPIVRVPN